MRQLGVKGEAISGTPRYMSPEQHIGENIGARSDQYSFCVTLWEALYGLAPYAGESVKDLAARLAKETGRVKRDVYARALALRDRWRAARRDAGVAQLAAQFAHRERASDRLLLEREPAMVAKAGDEKALPYIPPLSLSVCQTILPVCLSIFVKPPPAWA